MRRLVLLLTFLLLSTSSAHAAIAFVQGASNSSTGGASVNVAVTLPGSVNTANGLVAIVAVNNQATILTFSVSGGCDGSWSSTPDGGYIIATNLRIGAFSCPDAAAGTNAVTATAGSGDGFLMMILVELSGHATSSWFDVAAGQQQATANNATSGTTATSAQANAILLGTYFDSDGSVLSTNLSVTAETSPAWTLGVAPVAKATVVRMAGALEYRVVSDGPTTYAATWDATSVSGGASIHVYKAAATAAGNLFLRRRTP